MKFHRSFCGKFLENSLKFHRLFLEKFVNRLFFWFVTLPTRFYNGYFHSNKTYRFIPIKPVVSSEWNSNSPIWLLTCFFMLKSNSSKILAWAFARVSAVGHRLSFFQILKRENGGKKTWQNVLGKKKWALQGREFDSFADFFYYNW